MPFFAEETLQAVRSIPLYEIVRPRVELSRSGRNWKGLSPFTQEKSPSFFVLTEKNYFKCHSSGLAGDGIRFLQETEKLTFPEAVETLAERFGIPVRYAAGTGPDPEVRSLKQALYDIHEYARDYYHRSFLANHPESARIRDYWTRERGFSLALAEEFSIGYAPPDSRRLLDLLLKKGFSLKALAESGLFRPGRNPEDTSTWFFPFRGRLMIPIRDPQGQVVAFTARQLEETPKDHASWKAKYINSPETPLFKKGQLLFNLDRARLAGNSSSRMLLVEGQLDALRSWECGFKETVAPQGTSVTEEQLRLIKRYVDRLDLFFDSDEAGQRAVLRVLPMAFQMNLEPRVIQLPPGVDPDDFLRSKGKAGMDELPLVSGMQFAGQSLMAEDQPTPEHRSRVLNRLFELLEACPSAVVRDGYFEEAVKVTGVSPKAAMEDYLRFKRENRPREAASATLNSPIKGTFSFQTLTNLEGDLVWAVLQNVEWAEPLAQVIDHQWIRSDICEGKLLSRILDQAAIDSIEGKDAIYFLLETDDERDCFSRFVLEERPHSDMLSYVNETIAALARRFCRQRVSLIDQQITEHAQKTSDFSIVRKLMTEKKELILQMTQGPFPQVTLQP